MPEAVYLDTNTVVYWAKAWGGSQDAREQRCAANLESIIASQDSLACSPITLAEFVGVIWKLAKSQGADVAYFDQAAAKDATDHLMGLLASGRPRVNNLHPRAFEVGMAIVGSGVREHGEAFFAWDAIHLFQACQWSRVMEREVIVATSDSDFPTMLTVFPEFGRYVTVRDLTVQ